MGSPSRRVLAPVCTIVALLIAYVVVPTAASAAVGPHARRARMLLVDGSPAASPAAARKLATQLECNSCPLTRQPVCSESGLQFQNECLARCQGVFASSELCRQGVVFTAPAPAHRSQQSEVGASRPANDADGSVHKTSMRRFRDQGFLMVAARPPAELASAAQAAGGNRRSMQGSTSDPLPAPLLQSPPGLANLPAPPDPAEITEFRITPEGQVFAKTLTPTEMATYRAQRGRSSAAGDSSRGAAPDVLPPMGPMSGRRRLPEKYSTDVNDVHVDDESHEAEGAEAEQKDRHEESAVNAKTSGLQKRRRLSYVIPIRDDRLEETADVYPGRASGRFNYRNPADGLFYFCSGTLISNNAVLLAAHCVVDVTRSPVLWMDSYSFIPGARSGGVAPVGTAYVKFVTYTSLYTNTTPGNDLAVAILSTQPGDLIGWQGYGYDCLPTSYQVNTTGYPSDKAPGTRWRANCTTPAANPCNLSPTAGLAFIDCDTMAGQSGSPIFSNNPLSGPMTRFIVAYEARNATHQWNGAAVINNSTFPFIDNQVKNNRVFSPPPSPPPLPPLPPSPPSPPPSPPPRPPSPPSTVKTGRRSLRQSLQKLLRRQ